MIPVMATLMDVFLSLAEPSGLVVLGAIMIIAALFVRRVLVARNSELQPATEDESGAK